MRPSAVCVDTNGRELGNGYSRALEIQVLMSMPVRHRLFWIKSHFRAYSALLANGIDPINNPILAAANLGFSVSVVC